jgi:SAM-dependent methyltransferase
MSINADTSAPTRGHLRLVDGCGDDRPPGAPAASGHLRLVDGCGDDRPPGAPAAADPAAVTGYAGFYGPITGRLIDPLLDAAGVGEGTRVLDVATGPGCLAARAAQRGAAVVGVDIDPSMVALARRRHPRLDIREADAGALPFAAGSFDAVVGNFLVHHLQSPAAAIAELMRVLAPGGVLALTAWDLPARTRFVGVFLEAIDDCAATAQDASPRRDFFRYSADPTLAGLLAGQGLREVEVRTTAFAHPVASASALWDGLLAGTDRSSATRIACQPPAVKRRIRASFERRANAYRRGDRLELPVSTKLVRGRQLAA